MLFTFLCSLFLFFRYLLDPLASSVSFWNYESYLIFRKKPWMGYRPFSKPVPAQDGTVQNKASGGM
jgi:hypothetical protein